MTTLAELINYSDQINEDRFCTFNQQCIYAANKLCYDSEIALVSSVKAAAQVYLKPHANIISNNISNGQDQFSYYAAPHPPTARKMYFNRFDIMEAYYLFGSEYHSGMFSKEYAYMGRCLNKGFKPAPNLRFESLSDNGKAIYRSLQKNNV